jgi:putative membrane protein insertion efficiency factor
MTAFGRGVLWAWDHSIGFAVTWLLIAVVSVYRLAISPLLGPTCKYHPSCSAYALGALRQHGSLKGSALVGYRLLRCNPWSGGGVDPVPSLGRWQPDILPDGRPRVPMASS